VVGLDEEGEMRGIEQLLIEQTPNFLLALLCVLIHATPTTPTYTQAHSLRT